MSHEKITVVGSIALDDIETPQGKVQNVLGGSATYFSTVASLFTKIELVGVVGRDFPEEHKNFLASRGVGLDGLEKTNGLTFHWYGRYTDDLNSAQTLKVELNVFETFKPKIPKSAQSSPIVFLANIDPDLQSDVLNQVQSPRLTFCDTMNHWIVDKKDSLKYLLSQVDGIILNDGEARLLSQEKNLIKAAELIGKMGPKIIVIKKGEHGAQLWVDGEIAFVPPVPIRDVFDPTGAGDTFAGGFLGKIAEIKGNSFEDYREALYYGTAVASFTIEAFSLDRLKTLTRQEVEQRVEKLLSISQPKKLPSLN